VCLPTLQGFTTFSATFLAFTFVFGNSVSSVFEVRVLLKPAAQSRVCPFS
jgi:hypothetical protein